MNQAGSDIANLIERTFHIRTSVNGGTAFAIEQDDRQYWITAKHVIEGAADRVLPGETVRIYTEDGQAVVTPVQRIFASPGDIGGGAVDVAVLELARRFTFDGESPTIGCPEDLFVTQNVAMPSAEHWTAFGTELGITTRTGTIAKVVKPEYQGSATGDFLVDIEAYQGFSGGPIIYWDSDGKARLAGVAARLSWRQIPSFGSSPVHTGFIGCFHIQHALDLIQAVA